MREGLLLFVFLPISALAQVTLQPWVEGFGSYNGQQLGKYVTGITPSTNLPYRAAISQVGSTGIYRLNSPSDTSVQQVFFGENLLTGDLNNDGNRDVVVGKTVNDYDTVFVYWGTATGIDTLSPMRIPGENQFDQLLPGCIGDVNNDGKPDLLLNAWGAPGVFDSGKVYIFLNPIEIPFPNAVVVGDTFRAHLGAACAVGDWNGDGINDITIRGNKTGGAQSTWFDYVNIYWGTALDTLNVQLGLQIKTANLNIRGLASFDANGDGRDDLLWTALDSAGVRIFIHYGRTQFDTIPDIKLRNPGVGTFGYAVANAGDMNGDGYNDVMVGCPQASSADGAVIVYGGGPSIDAFVDAAVARGDNADFGRTISSLGDVTGDGLADFIVGGPFDPFLERRGRWGIFKGDSTIEVTALEERGSPVPADFALGNAYPNPFNPTTTIPYEAQTAGDIAITVTDVLGRVVTTLVQGEHQPGRYTATFDGTKYASGVYFYRMTATTRDGRVFTTSKKTILLSERERENQHGPGQDMFLRVNPEDMAMQNTHQYLRRFLVAPVQKPDTVLYLKDATIFFYDKDISRLKALGIVP